MKITMTTGEIDLLVRFLTASIDYFEFGMGGSTVLASRIMGRITAIESDAKWVEAVRKEIKNDSPLINLHHVNIGPTGKWGAPVGRTCENLFDDYSLSIRNHGSRNIDLCLVDGRFRVACFIEALRNSRSDAVIGIHDYTNRKQYHIVEKWARPIAICDTLAFFVRRPDANDQQMRIAADKFRRDPS
jgi:hypothetical protein